MRVVGNCLQRLEIFEEICGLEDVGPTHVRAGQTVRAKRGQARAKAKAKREIWLNELRGVVVNKFLG